MLLDFHWYTLLSPRTHLPRSTTPCVDLIAQICWIPETISFPALCDHRDSSLYRERACIRAILHATYLLERAPRHKMSETIQTPLTKLFGIKYALLPCAFPVP